MTLTEQTTFEVNEFGSVCWDFLDAIQDDLVDGHRVVGVAAQGAL